VGRGLVDFESGYTIPLNRFGTLFAARTRYSETRVVESPFDALDIRSDFVMGSLELSHPLRIGPDQLRLGLRADWRRTRSELGGVAFSFSEGADDGTSIVPSLRPFLLWIHRGAGSVFAARLMGSFGLPVLGATDVDGRLESARSVIGLLRAQWARRIDSLRGLELVARADLQLASAPLLALEQFAIGGRGSSRGHRSAAAVRDNGYALSIEARLPVWRRPDGSSIVQAGPFLDLARVWDKTERPANGGDTYASVGLGLRYQPTSWTRAELHYGFALDERSAGPNESIQDHGVHFEVSVTVPE